MTLPDANPSFRCQATVEDDKFPAWDYAAPWCDKPAVTTVPVSLITYTRIANVWLCEEHLREFQKANEI